jgi:hypothetical protein
LADQDQRPVAQLRRLANGYQVSQAIHVAATLGIADLLADGPRSSDELAARTDTDPRALYRCCGRLRRSACFTRREIAGSR